MMAKVNEELTQIKIKMNDRFERVRDSNYLRAKNKNQIKVYIDKRRSNNNSKQSSVRKTILTLKPKTSSEIPSMFNSEQYRTELNTLDSIPSYSSVVIDNHSERNPKLNLKISRLYKNSGESSRNIKLTNQIILDRLSVEQPRSHSSFGNLRFKDPNERLIRDNSSIKNFNILTSDPKFIRKQRELTKFQNTLHAIKNSKSESDCSQPSPFLSEIKSKAEESQSKLKSPTDLFKSKIEKQLTKNLEVFPEMKTKTILSSREQAVILQEL